MTELVLLRLSIPPSLEEELVNALLSDERIKGYQMWAADGHGEQGALSISEQVAGHRRRLVVEVQLDAAVAGQVLEYLQAQLPVGDIVYWLLPMLSVGRFSQ
jgi:hypothetical protein